MPLAHHLIAMASVADAEEEAATAVGVKRTEGGGGAVEDVVSILRVPFGYHSMLSPERRSPWPQ